MSKLQTRTLLIYIPKNSPSTVPYTFLKDDSLFVHSAKITQCLYDYSQISQITTNPLLVGLKFSDGLEPDWLIPTSPSSEFLMDNIIYIPNNNNNNFLSFKFNLFNNKKFPMKFSLCNQN